MAFHYLLFFLLVAWNAFKKSDNGFVIELQSSKAENIRSSCFRQGVKVVSLFLIEPVASSPAVLDFLYITAAPSLPPQAPLIPPIDSSYEFRGFLAHHHCPIRTF